MPRQTNDSRNRLIQTASELIWRHSYHHTTVDEICKAAGLHKGSFYHFFSSKTDLAIVAIENFYSVSQEMFENVFSSKKHPVMRINDLCDTAIMFQKKVLNEYGHVCGCPFISLGVEVTGTDEKIRTVIVQQIENHLSYYKILLEDLISMNLITPDISVDKLAYQIYSFILGQLTIARIENSIEILENNLRPGILRMLNLSASHFYQSGKKEAILYAQ